MGKNKIKKLIVLGSWITFAIILLILFFVYNMVFWNDHNWIIITYTYGVESAITFLAWFLLPSFILLTFIALGIYYFVKILKRGSNKK